MPSVETKAVEREIKIEAKPETVFSYLVEEEKMRRWMGIAGSWQPKPGNPFRLVVTNEDTASGKFVEVQPPNRLVFTFGWEGDDAVTKPGTSTVEITLKVDGNGTLVRLVHRDLPNEESAKSHGHGWEHYLARLAVAATGGDPGPDEFQ
jgi:uncharacterized protein YndB with AHSA1/START domain